MNDEVKALSGVVRWWRMKGVLLEWFRDGDFGGERKKQGGGRVDGL